MFFVQMAGQKFVTCRQEIWSLAVTAQRMPFLSASIEERYLFFVSRCLTAQVQGAVQNTFGRFRQNLRSSVVPRSPQCQQPKSLEICVTEAAQANGSFPWFVRFNLNHVQRQFIHTFLECFLATGRSVEVLFLGPSQTSLLRTRYLSLSLMECLSLGMRTKTGVFRGQLPA